MNYCLNVWDHPKMELDLLVEGVALLQNNTTSVIYMNLNFTAGDVGVKKQAVQAGLAVI
jgi:hypothetical protein